MTPGPTNGIMSPTGKRLLRLLEAARAKWPELRSRLAARAVSGRVQVVVFRNLPASPTLVSVDAPSFEAAEEMMR